MLSLWSILRRKISFWCNQDMSSQLLIRSLYVFGYCFTEYGFNFLNIAKLNSSLLIHMDTCILYIPVHVLLVICWHFFSPVYNLIGSHQCISGLNIILGYYGSFGICTFSWNLSFAIALGFCENKIPIKTPLL